MGRQRGKQAHAPDLDAVLARAAEAGVTRVLATGTDLAESREALRLACTLAGAFAPVDVRSTVGVHPTCCGQFEEERRANEAAEESERGGGDQGAAAGAGGPNAGVVSGGGASCGISSSELQADCGCSQLQPASNAPSGASAPRGEALLAALRALAVQGAADGRVAALGEMGLDGEREHFCPLDTQARWFERQLRDVCRGLDLPLFLHLRGDEAVAARFFDILDRNADCWRAAGGVVHSFDGSAETLRGVLDRGMHVGLNGCSVREARSLEVIKAIPLDRMLLETDAPWCGVRKTHAGAPLVKTWPTAVDSKKLDKKVEELAKAWEKEHPHEGKGTGAASAATKQTPVVAVEEASAATQSPAAGTDGSTLTALPLTAWPQIKGRNEPANVVQVAEIVAAARGESLEVVAQATAANAIALFWKT